MIKLKPFNLLVYLLLAVGAFFAILPFLWMISTSLMSLGETLNKQLVPSQAVSQGAENYQTAWKEGEFSKYFFNSVLITFTTLAGMLITCVLAAYAFARIHFPGRNIIFALLLATMMIPEAVTVIPLIKIIRGEILPLPFGPSWMNTLQGLTVPFMASIFNIFLLRQAFAKVPNELWDAARIDGTGHFRFLWQIMLPINIPVLLTVTLFSFIGVWNAFMWPLLVTTTPRFRPLMVGLWNFVTEAGAETQLLMAASVITIVPILIVFFFTQKYFTEGIASSGLKG